VANLAHLQEQLDHCTIKAPADGMVIYAQNDRGGEGRVVEGGQVRERQQLLRLPDTSKMKAVLRVNESQVPKLRPGQPALVKVVGLIEPLNASVDRISPLADGNQRWWNPDLKEYPVELVLEQTPPDLKPGVSVVGEIYTERLSDVLAVPLAAIYSDRSGNYVFVNEGGGDAGALRPTRVRIGQANDTHAMIREGVESGQSVLLLEPGIGRALLEKAKADGRFTPPAGAEEAERDRGRERRRRGDEPEREGERPEGTVARQ
jgi:multidrug efflux pump subunit AcrA (membrane-fusion protein)